MSESPPLTESSPADTEWQDEIASKGNLPRHIAVIPDGNGRWALSRGFARNEGHRRGVEAVRNLVRVSAQLDIEVLTLFVFSTENWSRPRIEVRALMHLLREKLLAETEELDDKDVRVVVSGRAHELPGPSYEALQETIARTENNKGIILNLAINYGGRAELVDALKRIVEEGIDPDEITEDLISRYVYHPELPDPDLLIRASGEQRMSNFLLWEMTYTEVVVTDVLWPDFSRRDFYEAISEYQSRERRFGKTGKQSAPKVGAD